MQFLKPLPLLPTKEASLLILDDIFPAQLSAFRIAEYNYYLRKIPNSRVESTGAALPLINEARSLRDVIANFEKTFPDLSGRAGVFSGWRRSRGTLAYTVFLNNIYHFLPHLTRLQIPFLFTLYPGGGLQLDSAECDRKLRAVCTSSLFRGVVITSEAARRYVSNLDFIEPKKVTFIPGVVLPEDRYPGQQKVSHPGRSRFKIDKPTLDICFVANKYMPRGEDKGYDLFIDCAKRLIPRHKALQFHVVGTFSGHEIELTNQERSRIQFYGPLNTSELSAFFSKQDVIVSPNRSNVLLPGAFDGFPTGSCVEAGLGGVALIITDTLSQNIFLVDGIEVHIVPCNTDEICSKIEAFLLNPDLLYQMASAGHLKLRKVYGLEEQMKPRLDLIMQHLSNPTT